MIPALQNFRTYGIAMDFYRECKAVKLPAPLRDQLTRASQGIVLTLAEGSAKPTAKDRARYYAMALGSFRECQSILSLAEQATLLQSFDHLGGCLYRLSRSGGK
ncbi:MAG: four helix bundle protein [Oligoflexia bacterium]|nr:four helix bundle protein [Oligoflexia bacterium]